MALQRAAGNRAVGALLRARTARSELGEMKRTAGYQGLTDAERARLDALVGGSTSVSTKAPAELRKILDDVASDKTDPETFRKFITDEKYLIGNVALAGATRLPAKEFALGAPTEVDDHEFRPVSTDAVLRIVTVRIPALVGSRRFDVPIYAPKAFNQPRPEAILPSHEVTAQVLAELPVESLVQIRAVNLNPWPNPDDAQWTVNPDYNPGGGVFESYMSADDGVVTIYPSKYNADLKRIEKSLMHETGHTVSEAAFGEIATDAGWDVWREAMANDGISVSRYGKSSVEEDYAESWSLWLAVATRARRTPRDALRTARAAEVAALIPNRVRVMETLLQTGKAP